MKAGTVGLPERLADTWQVRVSLLGSSASLGQFQADCLVSVSSAVLYKLLYFLYKHWEKGVEPISGKVEVPVLGTL